MRRKINSAGKKLWNLEIKQKKATQQQKALRLLAAFLCVMFVFTLLSRAADALSIARVTAAAPETKVIVHQVFADGSVKAKKEILIAAKPDFLVAQVLVKIGSQVQQGDTLYVVDFEDLSLKIDDAQKEIQKLKLQIADFNSQKETANIKAQTDLNRAQEDYARTKENGERSVARALAQLNAAENALSAFYDRKAECEQEASSSGADVREKLNGQQEDFAAQEQTLLADLESKKQAYEDVCSALEEALLGAARTIEDLLLPQESDSTGEQLVMELAKQEETLDELRLLLQNGGRVQAAQSGIVTEVFVSAGERTGDRALMLADISEGLYFTAKAAKEDIKYIKAGDTVSLKEAQGNTYDDLTVQDISESAKENGEICFDVTVDVSETSLNVGDSASMTAESDSGRYSCCVPVQALHTEGSKTYVLVLQKQKTVLGEEYTLARLDVHVLDKNTDFAALEEGTLTGEQRIVTETNKAVEEGSRVRME